MDRDLNTTVAELTKTLRRQLDEKAAAVTPGKVEAAEGQPSAAATPLERMRSGEITPAQYVNEVIREKVQGIGGGQSAGSRSKTGQAVATVVDRVTKALPAPVQRAVQVATSVTSRAAAVVPSVASKAAAVTPEPVRSAAAATAQRVSDVAAAVTGRRASDDDQPVDRSPPRAARVIGRLTRRRPRPVSSLR